MSHERDELRDLVERLASSGSLRTENLTASSVHRTRASTTGRSFEEYLDGSWLPTIRRGVVA
jgi:hypothetical protein